MRLFPRSLRWQLSLVISAVAVLCAAVCVAGAVLFLQRALTDSATREVRHNVAGVAGYLQNQESDLLGAARFVASDPAVASEVRRRDRQALIFHLTPLYADLNPDILDVTDARGRVILRMENTLVSGDAVRAHPSIRQALAGSVAIGVESDLSNQQAAGGYALRATVPVRSGNRVIGTISVGRLLDSSFGARVAHAVDADVNLVAGGQVTGTTVTDSNGLPDTGLPAPAGVLARIETGRTSIARVPENGHDALSGIVTLNDASGHPAAAVEVVRSLNPIGDVIRRLSLLLLALGAALALLATALALYFGRRLTSRLLSLSEVAASVAELAKDGAPLRAYHVPEPTGKDEVASLARAFTAMMAALDIRLEANARLYAAAQSRVRELSGLAEIARLLTATGSIRDTVDLLGEHVARLVGCQAVAIWLHDGDTMTLYGGHGLPDGYEALTEDLMGSEAAHLLPSQVALKTGALLHRRLAQPGHGGPESPVEPLTYLMHGAGLEWIAAVPLRVQNRTVGVLTCYAGPDTPLLPSDLSLLETIADQVAVALENARLSSQSRELAALEERQRLARELHDSVSQALYGVALGTRTALNSLQQHPDRSEEALQYVLTLVEGAITEMRALIFELRPEALETEGLVAVLERQIEAIQTRHGLSVKACLGKEPDVPFAVKEAAYRIAREALHNTVKHARAHAVEVTLHWDAEAVVLTVADDGRGFDVEGDFHDRLGLRAMRERAAQFGGQVQIVTAPNRGARLEARLPTVALLSGVAG